MIYTQNKSSFKLITDLHKTVNFRHIILNITVQKAWGQSAQNTNNQVVVLNLLLLRVKEIKSTSTCKYLIIILFVLTFHSNVSHL